nr:mycothiol synthase [Herbihabitans rhizosphaerae]
MDGVRQVLGADAELSEFTGGEHLIVTDDGAVLGYAHLNTKGDAFGRQIAHVFVHPDHRRRGVGTRMVESVLEHTDAPLRFWAKGDHPGAAQLASRFGLQRVRELLKMAVDFAAPETPALVTPSWPDGVRVRTFTPGADEDAVIEVNRRAFDWHPEQGALTADDLRAAQREPWFDADGFFLAVDAHDRVIGFHWTKVHPDGTGEVYVVGVHPDAQGGGLGKALTVVGLRHLVDAGHPRVILYVESDNGPAVAVYTRLGFRTVKTDVQYAR